MKKLSFSTNINAPAEKVWDVLWDDKSYREWTSAFHEGSYAETDWEEGSDVRFLGETGEGMFSKIVKKVPNSFMAFEHLGIVKGGVNQPIDEETKKWAGATENYTLTPSGNATDLRVDLDIIEDFEKYFVDTFPKALEKVKTISERN